MKRIPQIILAVVLGGALALQGCALFVVGAAVGAGAGAVSYTGNELRVTHDVTVDRAWGAAEAACKDLGFPVITGKSHKDAIGGTLVARNATDQPVEVQLIRQTDKLTEIRIRVGTFSTSANRASAQLLYDKLKTRL